MDKYEGNEWDNGEEYQVQNACNLMTSARNIRAFFRLTTIHQVSGGSEEVDLIMMGLMNPGIQHTLPEPMRIP